MKLHEVKISMHPSSKIYAQACVVKIKFSEIHFSFDICDCLIEERKQSGKVVCLPAHRMVAMGNSWNLKTIQCIDKYLHKINVPHAA